MQAGRLNQVAKRFQDRVEFLCIYIQEAHPTDGWQVLMNVNEEILYAQPRTEDERVEVAGACMIAMQLEMPMLLDELTNEVDTAYKALPERLYLIGADGRIAYRGGPGPFQFNPDEWERAIADHLGAS
ncbi:MAG: deiodinase-like protein [Myxococcota bacterium]